MTTLHLLVLGVSNLILGMAVLKRRQQQIAYGDRILWPLLPVGLFSSSAAMFLLLIGHPFTNIIAGIFAAIMGIALFTFMFSVLRNMILRRRKEGKL